MRRLKCAADGVTVLERGTGLDGIAVFCEGVQVPRVTKSHLRVWNAGFGPIQPTDVVQSNPLVVSVDQDSRILTARIINSTEEAIGFGIQAISERDYLLTFPYWGRNEGVVIELQHTSKQVIPNLRGTINGYKRIKSLGKVPTDGLGPTFQYNWPIPVFGLSLMAIGLSIAFKFQVPVSPAMAIAFILICGGQLVFMSTFTNAIARLRIPPKLR